MNRTKESTGQTKNSVVQSMSEWKGKNKNGKEREKEKSDGSENAFRQIDNNRRRSNVSTRKVETNAIKTSDRYIFEKIMTH